MGFDVSKAMEGEDPDKEASAADVAGEQAVDPLRKHMHEATRNLGFGKFA